MKISKEMDKVMDKEMDKNRTAPVSRGNWLLVIMQLAFFTIPFNFMNWLALKKFFGEFYYLACFYFLLILTGAALLMVFVKRILKLTIHPVYGTFLAVFGISVFISTALNMRNITIHYFKFRSGMEKFILQAATAFAVMLFIFVFYNLLLYYGERLGHSLVMHRIYKTADALIVFMILYCLLQYANMHFFTIPLFNTLDYLLHLDIEAHGRVRFVSFEVAQFGLFIAVILPFILVKLHREMGKIRNWLYLILTYVIIGFTFSRAAAANSLLLTLLFLLLTGLKIRKRKDRYLVLSLCCFALGLGAVFLGYLIKDSPVFSVLGSLVSYEGSRYEESNVSRFGMVSTGLSMIAGHPLGVGLGQYGFHFLKYLNFQGLNYEIQRWINPFDSLWPTTLNFYIRIGAELGLPGLIAFIYFWFSLLKRLCTLYIKSSTGYDRYELCIMLIVGCLSTGLQHDSLVNPSIWFGSALSIYVLCTAGGTREYGNRDEGRKLQCLE